MQVFATVNQLKRYLRTMRITFPAQIVTEGTVLKYLAEPRLNPDSHIDRFFLQTEYSKYPYDPMRPIMEQFNEMRNLYGWKKRRDETGKEVWDKAGKEAWAGIRRALVLEFNRYFGEDDKVLQSWIHLCNVIGGIDPVPGTLEGCIEVGIRLVLFHRPHKYISISGDRRYPRQYRRPFGERANWRRGA